MGTLKRKRNQKHIPTILVI